MEGGIEGLGGKKPDGGFWAEEIARGSYSDGGGWIVEARLLRLSDEAVNQWWEAELGNPRDCFESGPEGEEKWAEAEAASKLEMGQWASKMESCIGEGSLIVQVYSEVFAAVSVRQEGKPGKANKSAAKPALTSRALLKGALGWKKGWA